MAALLAIVRAVQRILTKRDGMEMESNAVTCLEEWRLDFLIF
jgi:hypothetical protein